MSQPKTHYLSDLLTAPPQTRMAYTRLGTSGLKVSKVILGAMSYGRKQWAEWVLEEEDALPLLKHAYDVGINTWDTVSSYAILPVEDIGLAERAHAECIGGPLLRRPL